MQTLRSLHFVLSSHFRVANFPLGKHFSRVTKPSLVTESFSLQRSSANSLNSIAFDELSSNPESEMRHEFN